MISAEIVRRHGHPETASETQVRAIEEELKERACRPLDDANLRNLLKVIKRKSDIVIDEGTVDQVTSAGYDLRQGRNARPAFGNHRDAQE